jgi:hypothetical protein
VIIPSGGPGERFFRNTIEDVLAKAAGGVEIFAVTDGWVAPAEDRVKDDRVTYLEMPDLPGNHKRDCINEAVRRCAGEYVMSLDCHCKVGEDFDAILTRDHQPNWVQVPQRRRLDWLTWSEQDQCGKPPISFEYWMWRDLVKDERAGLHGFKWDARSIELADVPIAPTPTMQASCWFMTREWFLQNDIFSPEGYTGWGQEAEQISLLTAMNGGHLISNSNTYFLHWHKGSAGRQYLLDRDETRLSYAYSFNLWLRERLDFFVSYIQRFPRMPRWPENWEEILRRRAASATAPARSTTNG